MNSGEQKPLRGFPSNQLKGNVIISGDKSISHRAVILGALSVGETKIKGLLESDDVLATMNAVKLLGSTVVRHSQGSYSIFGVGTGGFLEPDNFIDCGNSGTAVRLLIGAVSTNPITTSFTGDSSLRSRPMNRIIKPLSKFGTEFHGRNCNLLPMTVIGTDEPVPIVYKLPIPSAQVKSAVLLAGLNTPGKTTVIEEKATRDHTERMLKAFGAGVEIQESEEGTAITVDGYAELNPLELEVPSDPSSAAFIISAGLIVEDSTLTVRNIGMNPTRTGLFKTFEEMGANLHYELIENSSGEPLAHIHVKSSDLKGVEVPPERAPSMIDEYPILAAVAAVSEGDTVMRGVKELRVKETDRISAMVQGLKSCGVDVTEYDDGFTVHGKGRGSVKGDTTVKTHFDHRIAMSFLCLGLTSNNPITVDDGSAINTSFPQFTDIMANIGARIGELES